MEMLAAHWVSLQLGPLSPAILPQSRTELPCPLSKSPPSLMLGEGGIGAVGAQKLTNYVSPWGFAGEDWEVGAASSNHLNGTKDE